jgi:hypothetical protein
VTKTETEKKIEIRIKTGIVNVERSLGRKKESMRSIRI